MFKTSQFSIILWDGLHWKLCQLFWIWSGCQFMTWTTHPSHHFSARSELPTCPGCRLYDADLIKRLNNSLSVRSVKAKLNSWQYQRICAHQKTINHGKTGAGKSVCNDDTKLLARVAATSYHSLHQIVKLFVYTKSANKLPNHANTGYT